MWRYPNGNVGISRDPILPFLNNVLGPHFLSALENPSIAPTPGYRALEGATELINGWKLKYNGQVYDLLDAGSGFSAADESWFYFKTSPAFPPVSKITNVSSNVELIIEDESRLRTYPYHLDGYNREGFNSDGFDSRGFNSNGLAIDNNSGISINADKGVAGEILGIDEETSIENEKLNPVYRWQTSSDGEEWNEVGNDSTYQVSKSEDGKRVRVLVTYSFDTGANEFVSSELKLAETINIQENIDEVRKGSADESFTWLINGGKDADLFTIDSSTGKLNFKNTPDYENPLNADSDNRYEVIVQSKDFTGNTLDQTIFVNIENEEKTINDQSDTPLNYIQRGDSAYVVVDGPTREDAEANAQALGGNLVSINNNDENEWLVQAFGDNPDLILDNGHSTVHIGLVRDENGNYSWADGSEVTWNNVYNPELDTELDTDIVMNLNLPDSSSPMIGKWEIGTPPSMMGIAEISLTRENDAITSTWVENREVTEESELKLGYRFSSESGEDLSQLAVLGDSVDHSDRYTLEITAESLEYGYELQTADITVRFDPFLFNAVKASDITIGSDLPVANSIEIDNETGSIRFAAASLEALDQGASIKEAQSRNDSNNVLAIEFLSAFTGDDFEGKYFRWGTFNGEGLGRDLRGANFRGADLRNTNFRDANLIGADFTGADLRGAVFSGADLRFANLSEVRLGSTDFGETQLENSTFQNIDSSEIFAPSATGLDTINFGQDVDSYKQEHAIELAELLGMEALPEEAAADDSVLASISFDFNEYRLATLDQNADRSINDLSTPLSFSVTANQDETVFSTGLDDGSGYENREIKSLRELGGDVGVEGKSVTLYDAAINLEEQGKGLILGTQRIIGGLISPFTNLIRSGDTVTASSEWLNAGNVVAQNIQVTGVDNDNARLAGANFYMSETGEYRETANLMSGSFIDGVFDSSTQETINLVAEIEVTGAAGNVVDLSQGILSVQADGSEVFTNSQGSQNLITYQGDLNYDGRVSMKDLAYLNAGAARRVVDEDGNTDERSIAGEVDANYDGEIDLNDLAILDEDWGKSLHTAEQDFQGSSAEFGWEDLDGERAVGEGEDIAAIWDNTSFTNQNALEATIATGMIGADNDDQGLEGDPNGAEQDPLLG